MTEELSEGQKTPPEGLPPHKPQNHGSLILIAIVIGLFSLAAIGTTALFREKPVTLAIQKNANELIQKVLAPYPAVKFIYNQGSGGLLLLGHVSTPTDKSQILYNLSNLKFIKSTDDSGLVIDEGVWREMNSILSKNPAWKGISVQSPAAGQFILRGDLKTLKEAEQLSNYLSLNFSYLDLLKKDIVVEEDVLNQVNGSLRDAGLSTIIAKINNGELSLTGNVPSDKINDLAAVIAKAKTISGVRGVNNYVQTQATEMGMQNLSDQYEVTGKSKTGNKYFVMINGKILSEGDALDGLEIKKITSNTILLEKGDTKYRIDY
jgi:type III secretion system YscD/HrpQ family protein